MAKTGSEHFFQAAQISVASVSVLFLVEGFDFLTSFSLDQFGIVPRTRAGLIGIFFSPLLHANFTHLIANAVPLLVLLILLFWDRHYYPVRTLALIWLASGLGTWLIGRGNAVHIGASSIIFGLVAYLIASGLWMRSWRSAFVAALVLLLYGGIFFGVLPQPGPISWEGHLTGAVAGLWAAKRNHLP